jgi:hypothetical protein
MILEILFPRREISILTLVSNTPYTRSLLNVSCHNNLFLSLVKNIEFFSTFLVILPTFWEIFEWNRFAYFSLLEQLSATPFGRDLFLHLIKRSLGLLCTANATF